MLAMNVFKTIFCLSAILHLSHGDEFKVATSELEIKKKILNAHNELRAQVNPKASNMMMMEWNTQAEEHANKVAKKCEMAHSGESERTIHSPSRFACGENIFFSDDLTDWESVVRSWHSEKDNFVYGVGPTSPESVVSHYTQVVWYNSYLVGCGFANCTNRSAFSFHYACLYCPAGNNRARIYKPYNTGKACAKCQHGCDRTLCKPQS